MFDTLPNGEQTKAVGKLLRNIEVGDKLQPFLASDRFTSILAYEFAYPHVDEFTFEDTADEFHLVKNGRYVGETDSMNAVHFDYIGRNISGDIKPIMAVDEDWQKLTLPESLDKSGLTHAEKRWNTSEELASDTEAGTHIMIRNSDGIFTIGTVTSIESSLVHYDSIYGYGASARISETRLA